jgi:hypothetical protein
MSLSEDAINSVIAQLGRILESEYFRGSQRSSRFLQYSVEKVLSGCNAEELKERIIGVEVFHRSSDYDTAQDSTVRVTANEVRKRLAQYYGKAMSEDPVIEVPSGSYAVVFRWNHKQSPDSHSSPNNMVAAQSSELTSALPFPIPQEPDAEPPASKPDQLRTRFGRRSQGLLAAAIASIVLLAAISYGLLHRNSDALSDAWRPLLSSRQTVAICVAEPTVYLYPQSRSNVPIGPEDHMVPFSNTVIGIGDAYALADITGFLESRSKAWYLLPSNNTPFRDLTTGPVVLIGSFSNQWATRLLGTLRFAFVQGPPNRLVDRNHPAGGWTIQVNPDWTVAKDYALISRFQSPDTGEPIIAVAGATNFGTEAAGKLLTNPDMLAAVLHDAPKDWKSKNFQIVLQVKVQGSTPEQPTVIDKYFW